MPSICTHTQQTVGIPQEVSDEQQYCASFCRAAASNSEGICLPSLRLSLGQNKKGNGLPVPASGTPTSLAHAEFLFLGGPLGRGAYL